MPTLHAVRSSKFPDNIRPILPWDPRPVIRRRAADAGVDLPDAAVEELYAHLDDVYDGALDGGASADEARDRALAALDESPLAPLMRHAGRHPDRTRRALADAQARTSATRSWNVTHALRVALRQFRAVPTFAAVTVLVLGLGTGAATTVFTVVDAVVLSPLPYRAADRLVTLWDTNSEKGLAHDPISPVNFMDYRALPVFEDAAAWWRPAINLVDPGQDPVRVNTIEVSANLFTLLGVGPQVGSGFPAGGPLHSSDRIAVISDRLWRARYSADPSIIGRPLTFNSAPYTIVGVMPPGFHYPDDVDVWQRLQWDLTQHSRAAHFMEAVLRLADGTTTDQARSAAESLGLRLQTEFVETNKGWGPRLVPLLDEQLGYYRPALAVLLGAVGLLLAIAVLNVASLLLTRSLSRGPEMAVRLALGASSRHLVAQLMAESAVLSVAGTAVGIAVAWAALPIITSGVPVGIPRLEEAAVDVRALAVSILVVVATTLVFGLVPALSVLRTPLGADLKSGERGSSRGTRRLYSVLVGAEVAIACALLGGSALLVRTVRQMVATPTGVNADTTLVAPVQLTPRTLGAQPDTPAREAWSLVARTHTRILDEVRAQPGVVSAGGANFLPLGVGWRNPFALVGEPLPARQEDLPQVQMHSISDGYLESMGATVVTGRAFGSTDEAAAPPVVIVNETFARRYLENRGPLGASVRMWSGGIGPLGVNLAAPPDPRHEGYTFEIVGVIADIKNGPLGQDVEPAVYFTTRQFPFGELFVTVRAADPTAARAALGHALRTVVPTVPMGVATTWGERFAATSAEARLLMSVLLGFGGLAALLAALGVYGLFSWSVAMRTRELAIRLTLGAAPAAVGRSVLGQGAWLVSGGLVAGLLILRLSEAAITRVLYGVSTSDAAALATAAGVLLLAATGACVPAALRAMRIDPAVGLRIE